MSSEVTCDCGYRLTENPSPLPVHHTLHVISGWISRLGDRAPADRDICRVIRIKRGGHSAFSRMSRQLTNKIKNVKCTQEQKSGHNEKKHSQGAISARCANAGGLPHSRPPRTWHYTASGWMRTYEQTLQQTNKHDGSQYLQAEITNLSWRNI